MKQKTYEMCKAAKVVILLVVFVLLLSACAPAEIPTAPTGSEEPTSAPSQSPSQNTDSELLPLHAIARYAFRDMGNICDFAPYEDGYLLLTHKGLFRTDANFENIRSAGSEYDALFATEDGTGPFTRLRLQPDSDSNALLGLNVFSDDVYFYCVGNKTVYRNAEAWLALDWMELSEEPHILMEEYQGSVYTLAYTVKEGLENFFSASLYKDGEKLMTGTIRGFWWDDGVLYFLRQDEEPAEETFRCRAYPYTLICADDLSEKHGGIKGIVSTQRDGWNLFESEQFGLMRAKGDTYQYLSCPYLETDEAPRIRLYADSDDTLLLLSEAGAIYRMKYTEGESFALTFLHELTMGNATPVAPDKTNILGQPYFIETVSVSKVSEFKKALESGEYDIINAADYPLLSECVSDGLFEPLDELLPEFCADDAYFENISQWLDFDGVRYVLPTSVDFLFADSTQDLSYASGTKALFRGELTLRELVSSYDRTCITPANLMASLVKLFRDEWIDPVTGECDFSDKAFTDYLDLVRYHPIDKEDLRRRYDIEVRRNGGLSGMGDYFWRFYEEIAKSSMENGIFTYTLSDGKESRTLEICSFIGIAKNSSRKEETAHLLQCLVNTEPQEELIQMYRPVFEKYVETQKAKLLDLARNKGADREQIKELETEIDSIVQLYRSGRVSVKAEWTDSLPLKLTETLTQAMLQERTNSQIIRSMKQVIQKEYRSYMNHRDEQ